MVLILYRRRDNFSFSFTEVCNVICRVDRRAVIVGSGALLLAGHGSAKGAPMTSESVSDSPEDLRDGWRVGNPTWHGFDPALLQDMRRRVADGRLDNVHAIIVARDGVLVYEQYAAGQDQNGLEPAKHTVFNAATKHNGNSMTKSVISLLVGVALQRGWIKTLDAPVLDYFPEYADLRTPERGAITLYHLLTMSDGLDWSEFKPPFDSFGKMRGAKDAYRYVLEQPAAAPPGHTYNYNSGATELIGAVLRKTSGKSLDSLARDELFEPLGIEDVEWNRQLPDGQPQASGALRARPRDWAKLGQLVINRGVWNNRQIVPSAWIADSIKPHNNGPGLFLYGYHWWLGRSFCRGKVVEWAGAMGWGGQRLMIVPDLGLVALALAWLPKRMTLPEEILLNEFILPAAMPS
ncbi:serine hydrolase [Bradyrhizobium sp.]|uniref:serine hydrolase domain-containing protein n=1 Tax=Bradyrhizobium sp. TaxID=376 RepID=UPI002DDD9573|nr:serine hydrolase [Bradyrhizobium sp.]HEV2155142.1 serine hydrolase [Bradyrhizobium sp.]